MHIYVQIYIHTRVTGKVYVYQLTYIQKKQKILKFWWCILLFMNDE